MRIILPGELLFSKPVKLPFTRIENGKSYATVVTFLNDEDRAIPLEGKYTPKRGDRVVGIIVDNRYSFYLVDINTPWKAILPVKSDRERRFKIGDAIWTRIRDVDETNTVILEDARPLRDGLLINFDTVKIPRLIGKKSSMINLIMEKTNSNITVGSNGYIWIKGDDLTKVLGAIDMIDRTPHIPGLTDRITNYLEGNDEA